LRAFVSGPRTAYIQKGTKRRRVDRGKRGRRSVKEIGSAGGGVNFKKSLFIMFRMTISVLISGSEGRTSERRKESSVSFEIETEAIDGDVREASIDIFLNLENGNDAVVLVMFRTELVVNFQFENDALYQCLSIVDQLHGEENGVCLCVGDVSVQLICPDEARPRDDRWQRILCIQAFEDDRLLITFVQNHHRRGKASIVVRCSEAEAYPPSSGKLYIVHFSYVLVDQD